MGLLQMGVHRLVVAVGLAISSRIAPTVGDLFSVVTDNENAQSAAGFIAVFLILFIAGGVASFWLRMVLGIIPFFGSFNKLGGLIVGILVGFLLLSGKIYQKSPENQGVHRVSAGEPWALRFQTKQHIFGPWPINYLLELVADKQQRQTKQYDHCVGGPA